jgi:hypothetical protein
MRTWKHFVIIGILVLLNVKIGINAEERFDIPIVEILNHTTTSGREYYHAGVDIDNDGFADIFIFIPETNREPMYRRLAGFLREGVKVSFDDKNKTYSQTMGFYSIEWKDLLEINGRSVLQIFPSEEAEFPTEAIRQRRFRQ